MSALSKIVEVVKKGYGVSFQPNMVQKDSIIVTVHSSIGDYIDLMYYEDADERDTADSVFERLIEELLIELENR